MSTDPLLTPSQDTKNTVQPSDAASSPLSPGRNGKEPSYRMSASIALVMFAGFSWHVYRWFQRKPERLVSLLSGEGMRGRDWSSFIRNGLGYAFGALAIWILISWLVARKRRRPIRPILHKGSRAFVILLPFAPLALLHCRSEVGGLAFLLHTALIVGFVVALARVYDLDFASLFEGESRWRRPTLWAVVLGAFFILDMTLCSIYRYFEFTNHLDDLGLYDQLCWGLTRGYGFLTTIYPMPRDSFLAEHIVPTVAVFAQLYRVWANPLLLLLLQAVALTASGWLVFHIAQKRTGTRFVPALLTVSFFINPLLQRGWINDFHIDALEVFLYLAAYACLLEGRSIRHMIGYWVAVVLLLGCKEDVALSLAALGFVVAIAHRRWVTGLLTLAVGMVWSYVAITKLLPYFGSLGGAEIAMNRQLENYAHLGATPREIALAPILHPGRVMKAMLNSDRLVSVMRVLGPVAFLPLLSPLFLLLLGPMYLTTILSGWDTQYNLHTHYGLVFLAPAYIGAIEGWRKLEGWWGTQPRRLGLVALGAACLMVITSDEFRKFPFGDTLRWRRAYRTSIDRGEVREIGRLIPKDAGLSADEGLGSHFSGRRHIYKFPVRPSNKVDFILLNFRKENPLGDGQIGKLRALVVNLVREEGYGIRKLEGDTLLLEKDYTDGEQAALLAKIVGKIRR